MRHRKLTIAIVTLAVIAAAGYRLLYPPPPNVENDGYASASFEFREYDESLPALKASTSDPAMVRALARVIAKGKNDINCRCINLGVATFTRPDGKQFAFLIMPAHSVHDCQIAVGGERYAVDREQLLSAVAPLGVPAVRWTGP